MSACENPETMADMILEPGTVYKWFNDMEGCENPDAKPKSSDDEVKKIIYKRVSTETEEKI